MPLNKGQGLWCVYSNGYYYFFKGLLMVSRYQFLSASTSSLSCIWNICFICSKINLQIKTRSKWFLDISQSTLVCQRPKRTGEAPRGSDTERQRYLIPLPRTTALCYCIVHTRGCLCFCCNSWLLDLALSYLFIVILYVVLSFVPYWLSCSVVYWGLPLLFSCTPLFERWSFTLQF